MTNPGLGSTQIAFKITHLGVSARMGKDASTRTQHAEPFRGIYSALRANLVARRIAALMMSRFSSCPRSSTSSSDEDS
jgi:hypothetical protein